MKNLRSKDRIFPKFECYHFDIMFKWKVSRLGGGSKKDRNKQKLNNESVDTGSRDNEEIYSKNNNVINKER